MKFNRRKFFRRFGRVSLVLLCVLVVGYFWFKQRVTILPPAVEFTAVIEEERVVTGVDSYSIRNNWLRKNEEGLYEMYLEGSPYELGLLHGKLAKELVQKQEDVFVDQIKTMIPVSVFRKFLNYFIAWFNRDIDTYIPIEYLQEIYGVSQSSSDAYNNVIGPKYNRILNYHAAHDIGHALVDMKLVGCTSFAVWDKFAQDSSLLIGRNFDFYAGDAFAEDKLIGFIKPKNGHPFMYVTWGGMIGVVSGMNNQGLTVTINASKSEMPKLAATPISIVAREILQYATNIEEAVAIAKKRKVFVSESLLIGSANDKRAVIIEKAPEKMGVYAGSSTKIICSNHYQSDVFKSDAVNIENIESSSSGYRMRKMQQLLHDSVQVDTYSASTILRDRSGLNFENIGNGNENAINQLIAHHAIIFKPESREVWVSSPPYQLGTFVHYNLDSVFSIHAKGQPFVSQKDKNIQSDTFLDSGFATYEQYKLLKDAFTSAIEKEERLVDESIKEVEFIRSNTEMYWVYVVLGDYYMFFEDNNKAVELYQIALEKSIPTFKERDYILAQLSKLKQ